MEKLLTESEKVEQQNKLIAEFMGATIDELGNVKFVLPADGVGLAGCGKHALRYHSSWDWLMPVVQKIVNAGMDSFDSYALWVADSLRTADIKQVYQAVINFLEQDNPRN